MNINKGKVMSLECKKCGRWVENVGDTAVTVTCSVCVLLAVGLPEEKKSYTPTGRPPGWHFMAEFVDTEGNVFHKGKEIKKLKGTLPPTKITSKRKKKTRRRTKDEIYLARHELKKAALKKAAKKQQDFLNHNINKG